MHFMLVSTEGLLLPKDELLLLSIALIKLLTADFIMMTSSNGNIFRVTGPLCGEFTGPGEFPAEWPVTQSFDVFFDLHLNRRLSKQPWGWWFETPPWSLWHQCNDCWTLWGGDGACINIKVLYFPFRNSHCENNMVLWWSNLYDGNPL